MDFEKKNNIYRMFMAIVVTAIITFIGTTILLYNYFFKTEEGLVKTLIKVENSSLETKINLIKKYIDESYLGEINEDDMSEMAVKGYVAGLGDMYTEYLTKDEYEELMVEVNGDYVGIGIYMYEDNSGNIVVLEPIEGSPAEAAGLQTGDIIKKVMVDMKLSVKLCYPFIKLGAKIFGKFDLEATSSYEAVKNAKIPIIFFHGKEDTYVPYQMSEKLYDACSSMKKLVLIDNAEHGISYLVDPDKYLKEARDFFEKVI